jgi:DNA-binding Lrp family transcriptional regulator
MARNHPHKFTRKEDLILLRSIRKDPKHPYKGAGIVAKRLGLEQKSVYDRYRRLTNEEVIWRPWTELEDRLLISVTHSHPDNLQYCFVLVATQLERTPGAVQARYYKIIKPRTEPLLENDHFAIKGDTTMYSSRKNTWRNEDGTLPSRGIVVGEHPIREMFKKLKELLGI